MNQHKDTESVKGDELTLQHRGSIISKKLKHTSSLPVLGSQAEKSKYATNVTLNSTQFESSMVNKK